MSDNVDNKIYPFNDDTIIARPEVFRANPTTGVDETIPLTGRTDGIAFVSLTEPVGTAVAIAGTQVALVEIGTTATYTGILEGSSKATAFANLEDRTRLFRHVQFGSDFRRSLAVTYRTVRS
jgi:hypothetical protein